MHHCFWDYGYRKFCVGVEIKRFAFSNLFVGSIWNITKNFLYQQNFLGLFIVIKKDSMLGMLLMFVWSTETSELQNSHFINMSINVILCDPPLFSSKLYLNRTVLNLKAFHLLIFLDTNNKDKTKLRGSWI